MNAGKLEDRTENNTENNTEKNTEKNTENLYEKYGGFAGISKIVHTFYRHIIESDFLYPYYAHLETSRLIGHQIKMFCKVLGGPDNYVDRTLVEIHHKYHVTPEAYQEIIRCLRVTLQEEGFAPADTNQVIKIVLGSQTQIVTQKSHTAA